MHEFLLLSQETWVSMVFQVAMVNGIEFLVLLLHMLLVILCHQGILSLEYVNGKYDDG